MRALFSVLAVILVTVILVVWKHPNTSTEARTCEKPLLYSIGFFDRRFGVSYQNFLGALLEAEAVWEESLGIELFTYNQEEGNLAVNLIYDYRQEVTTTLEGIEGTVEESESSYKARLAEFQILKVKYESAKGVYDKRALLFGERSKIYEAKVKAWNEGSRVSKQEFRSLEEERVSLEGEMSQLNILQLELNKLVEQLNESVNILNYLAQALNLNVEIYNTIGASRGDTFTGGLYSTSEEGRKIDVFEFGSREKLVRVLAHELGHALGIEHTDDPESIMYHLNKSQSLALSQSDLVALRDLCKIE